MDGNFTKGPDDFAEYFCAEDDEMLCDTFDRVGSQLQILFGTTSHVGIGLIKRKLWRARIVIGMARWTGTLGPGHTDVAVAIELLNFSYNLHLLATNPRLASDMDLPTDSMSRYILSGDYYLTRAAVAALRSDRLATLGAIATIMRAIPTGEIALLETPASLAAALRHYRTVQRYLMLDVVHQCLRASFSESGLLDGNEPWIADLAYPIAINRCAVRDWNNRVAGTARAPGWDLPTFFACRNLPPAERAALVRLTTAPPGAADPGGLNRIIAGTGGMSRCAALGRAQFARADSLLRVAGAIAGGRAAIGPRAEELPVARHVG